MKQATEVCGETADAKSRKKNQHHLLWHFQIGRSIFGNVAG